MQVVPHRQGLAGRDYHDDDCRKQHAKEKPKEQRRRYQRNDLSGVLCGGIFCLESIPRKENCWVTLWHGKCMSCGEVGKYRSTDLRLNPPAACKACRRKYKIK